MDPDIEFGEVERLAPAVRPRPDENGQLAVQAVGTPHTEELAIFIDWDVLREILDHACSDRQTELGGVLLGGQFSDERGRPFVTISECLRARHYESTKGSFKFTHETWEQVTRDRAALPADLQMVGWYHTHPGWGVFLSGLDLFICDHFFNHQLDVALVVDPCRNDAGFFQWTGQSEERIRRTGGYYVVTSRFREAELREFVRDLENRIMPEAGRSSTMPLSVHVPPPPPTPVWQTIAVLGMLSAQFCLIAVLAWYAIVGPSGRISDTDELVAVRSGVQHLEQLQQQESEIDAKLEVLEMVLRRDEQLPDGVLQSLADRTREVAELRGSLRGQQSLAKELDDKVSSLEALLDEVRRGEERGREERAALEAKVTQLTAELAAANVSPQSARSAKSAADPVQASGWSALLADGRSLGLGVFLGAAVSAAIGYVMLRRPNDKQGAAEPNATTHDEQDD